MASNDLNRIRKSMIDPEFVQEVQDTTNKIGNLSELKTTNKTDIVKSVNEVSSQLADTATKDEVANYYYTPKRIQAIDGSEGINVSTIKSAGVYALYDGLMGIYPDYITKTLLGNDQSGVLPVYKYEFKPESYAKTIIVGANMHGGGSGGDPKDDALALYLFMKDLCVNWDEDKKLSELRWGTHFVVLPIQNPWGFDNDYRQNSNGVDLNRNFDWKWAEYVTYTPWHNNYKGTAPFSEKESQYIRDVLLSYPKAVAYLDFHVWLDTTTFKYVYAAASFSVMNGLANNITKYLTKKYNTTRQIETNYDNNPSGYIYSEKICKIPSSNPEYVVNTTDIAPRASEAMTKMVEWYGNFIYLSTTENIKIKNRLSTLQSNASMVVGNTNTALKSFSDKSTLNPFEFDATTGEFIIPKDVTRIRLSAQVYFNFNSNTEERMQIAVFIQKNNGRLTGYPVSKNVVTLGGAHIDLREYVTSISSPIIGVAKGDRFKLSAYTSHTGGLLTTFSNTLEGTWFAVEEVEE